MSKHSVLEREPIVLPVIEETSLDTERLQLAEKATKLLGYSAFKTRLIQKAEAAKIPPLLQVLKDLEIEPYSKESVEKYKNQKAKEYNKPDLIDWIGVVCLYGFALFLVGGWACSIWWKIADNHTPAMVIHSLRPISYGLSVICGVVVFCISAVSEKKGVIVARWKTVPLAGYDESVVPDHVVYKAVSIKERLPEAVFKLDQLVLEKVKDPFLIVEHNGLQKYIEVWDESDFENKL